MENINNKANFLKKHGIPTDIVRGNDILSQQEVKIKDVLNGQKDERIDKMSDVFPKSQNDDDDLLS